MTMQALKIAYDKLKLWEGCKLKPYEDVGGWAVGYGHQIPAKDKATMITQAQAEVWLQEDIVKAASAIVQRIGSAQYAAMNVDQQAAIISFVFNVGRSAFATSTLAKCLDKGEYDAVPEQLARWNKGEERQVVPGLVTRRYKEAMLFLGADSQ